MKKQEKKTARFYLALAGAKILIAVMRLFGKHATHVPGRKAINFCPDFLGQIDKPEVIIGVTGTNGKTTVCNMISDVLKDNGYEFVGNQFGGNIDSGIASALIKEASLTGKVKKKLALFEIDERMTTKIFPFVQPDYLVCTNLFRDSYRRNAHTEFISGILNSQIPENTKLILNGEDLISNHLAMDNPRSYFGISCPDGHSTPDNIIKDIVACPQCGATLKYDYIRYNHIGRAHCPNCDYGSPDMDYAVESIDYDERRCMIKTPEGSFDFKIVGENITDIYNMVTVIAALSEFGLTAKQLQTSFEKLKVTASRYESETIGGKEIILNLAKGQNPIACSRVCDYVQHEKGRKTVVCMFDDFFDAKESSENIAWIFDIDFEFLRGDDIGQIVLSGPRHQDYHLRLLMAGIPEEKLVCCEKETDTAAVIDTENADKIFILFDIYTIQYAHEVREVLRKKIEKAGDENDKN